MPKLTSYRNQSIDLQMAFNEFVNVIFIECCAHVCFHKRHIHVHDEKCLESRSKIFCKTWAVSLKFTPSIFLVSLSKIAVILLNPRSIRLVVFCTKGFLYNFAKFAKNTSVRVAFRI